MLDELLDLVVLQFLARVFRIIFFPVALLVCTPFILVRAAVFAARHKAKFRAAVADGYSSVDVYWWS